MRKAMLTAVMVVILAGAGTVWAQRKSPFETVNPRDITYQPVNVTRHLAAPALAQPSKPSSFLNFLPRMSLPGFLSASKPAISPGLPTTTLPNSSSAGPIKPQQPFINR